MPWTVNNLPDSAKNLTAEQKSKFVSIANAILKESGDEGMAIATALKKVKNMSEDPEDFFEEQWVEVFRAGKQTDSAGNTQLWTADDLNKIVLKYNNQTVHEAPVVLGHPVDNAPAFGWVDKLKTDGTILYAKFKQLVPEFIEAVKQGLYKKRSISLYRDLTLRHIGFLGAMPPAVKGLANIKFEEGEDTTIEYKDEDNKGDNTMPKLEELEAKLNSFGEVVDNLKKENDALKLKNDSLEKKFQEQADAATAAATNAKNEDEDSDEYAEGESKCGTKGKGKPKPKKSEFEETAAQDITTIKAKLAAAESRERKGEFSAFITKLHNEGKIVTDQQNILIDLMEAIHGVGEYQFGENKADVLATFKAYLEKQPKIAEFGDTGCGSKKDVKSVDVKFNDVVEQIMVEQKCNYREAFEIAQKKNPELAMSAFNEEDIDNIPDDDGDE